MTENTNHQPEPAETPLESWKEISAYLKRAVRTVKRWEQFEGLPVHRHQHQSRSSVYAYPSELDSWLATREPESLREDEAVAPIPRWRALTALAAVILLALVSVGSGPLPTQANAVDGPQVVAKRVWAGDGVDNMGSPSRDGKLLSFVDWSTGDLAVRDLEKNVSRRQRESPPRPGNPAAEAFHRRKASPAGLSPLSERNRSRGPFGCSPACFLALTALRNGTCTEI